jgi:hypothetical protein
LIYLARIVHSVTIATVLQGVLGSIEVNIPGISSGESVRKCPTYVHLYMTGSHMGKSADIVSVLLCMMDLYIDPMDWQSLIFYATLSLKVKLGIKVNPPVGFNTNRSDLGAFFAFVSIHLQRP